MKSNEVRIINLFQYFNNRNWQALAAFYDDSIERLHPANKSSFIRRGRWDIQGRMAALERKYAGVTEHIHLVSSMGDQVFVHYTSKGIDVQGLPYELPAWSIFTLKNGKIIREASYISVPDKQAA